LPDFFIDEDFVINFSTSLFTSYKKRFFDNVYYTFLRTFSSINSKVELISFLMMLISFEICFFQSDFYNRAIFLNA